MALALLLIVLSVGCASHPAADAPITPEQYHHLAWKYQQLYREELAFRAAVRTAYTACLKETK